MSALNVKKIRFFFAVKLAVSLFLSFIILLSSITRVTE